MKRLTLRITGRVQGVGFRAFVYAEARQLGLSGYVRNCEDGAVETVAEGDEERLRQLEASLRRGPSLAIVRQVDTRWSEATGGFPGFQMRY